MNTKIAICFALLIGLCPSITFAHFIERVVVLTGANGASGFGTVVLDVDVVSVNVQLSFSNLTGTTTSSQIFGVPKANLAAMGAVPLASFPVGLTNGTYSRTIDLTQAGAYSPAFLTAADTGQNQIVSDAFQAFHDSLEGEVAFIRINTTAFPNGELSGFLVAVPEPSSWMLFATLLTISVGTILWRHYRRAVFASGSVRVD